MPTEVATLPVLDALERELALHRELLAATGAGTYRLDLEPPLARDLPDEAQVDHLLRRARVGAANDAMAALHGYARGEDLIGRGLGELVDAANAATRQAVLGFLRAGCRYHDVETPVVDRAGRPRILLHSALGVLESGALVAIWGTQRDLTEERQTLERLRQSEQRFRQAFQLNPAAIVLSTLADGRLLDINAAFATLVGRPREALLGRTAAELRLWDSEAERERILARIRDDGFALRVPARVRRADGELRLALVSGMAMEVEGERCLLTLSEDVTEQQRTAEALRHAEEEQRRLEREMQEAQRLEALGLLAGGVAHDFNNLLTGIQGYAELARRRVEAGSPLAPLLEEILVGARRAGELTQKMLAFAGGAKLEIAWLGLNEVVAEMAELARVALPARGTLELELARPGPGLEADATQIRQVAMNLMINAAEAIDGGSGRIRVSTGEVWCDRTRLDRATGGRERPEGRYAFFTVADDGCGMPEPVRARIFDPFFSTKFTGRGLGLAAVLGIVRSHRGAIEVESAAGLGSTFTVLLPLALASGRPIER